EQSRSTKCCDRYRTPGSTRSKFAFELRKETGTSSLPSPQPSCALEPCRCSPARTRNDAEETQPVAPAACAIISTRAVLPEPFDPITAVSPGFTGTLGVESQASPFTLMPTTDELAPPSCGGASPIETRRSGSKTVWRNVSNTKSP